MKKNNYQLTMYACFIGYIVQAIVNNFLPLLFVTFQKTYSIPLTQITLLITLNFGIQLVIDMLSAGFVDKIGYRASAIIAHVCSAPARPPDSPAGSVPRPIRRNSDRRIHLRHRGRAYRGTDKSDTRSLPHRQQGKGDEPSALLLLLGTCRSSSYFHADFSHCSALRTGRYSLFAGLWFRLLTLFCSRRLRYIPFTRRAGPDLL